MIAGGVIAWFFGVDAERKSLEDIANPLSVVSEREEIGRPRRGATRVEGAAPMG